MKIQSDEGNNGMCDRIVMLPLLVLVLLSAVSCHKGPVQEAVSHKHTYQDAYVYGFR